MLGSISWTFWLNRQQHEVKCTWELKPADTAAIRGNFISLGVVRSRRLNSIIRRRRRTSQTRLFSHSRNHPSNLYLVEWLHSYIVNDDWWQEPTMANSVLQNSVAVLMICLFSLCMLTSFSLASSPADWAVRQTLRTNPYQVNTMLTCSYLILFVKISSNFVKK